MWFVCLCSLRLQVIEEVTEFYKQTYNNYKDTRQEALKETLRLIHFGVSTHTHTHTHTPELLLLLIYLLALFNFHFCPFFSTCALKFTAHVKEAVCWLLIIGQLMVSSHAGR